MDEQQQAIDWTPLRGLIEEHDRFVLTCHVRPDCDALGSELAMACLLRSLGKSVRIVNADPIPPRLAFLDPSDEIEVLGDGVEATDIGGGDLLMVLDTSAWKQLGAMADVIRNTAARVAVIDHHASESEIPAVVFKDSRVEATGRLVFEAARFLGVPISADMAVPLFAAIATDTGWLRFPSTTAQTYHVMGDLVASGARPHEIFRNLYERDSMSRVKLRALVLSRLTTELDGRLAHTYVLADDFDSTGALPSETEDFINMGLAVTGTEVAVMFTEQPSGVIKVSFRSRSSVDCSSLASTFKGGGHRAAAGATVQGTFESAQAEVLQAVRAIMTP